MTKKSHFAKNEKKRSFIKSKVKKGSSTKITQTKNRDWPNKKLKFLKFKIKYFSSFFNFTSNIKRKKKIVK